MKSGEELSLDFDSLMPYGTIEPKEYKLNIWLFYQDEEFEYTSTVFSQTAVLILNEEALELKGLFSLIITFGKAFFLT